VGTGELADAGHRVDGGGAGAAHGGDDGAGPVATGDVGPERLLQRVGTERMGLVAGEQAEVLPAEAGEQRSLLDGAVSHLRGVDDERGGLGLKAAPGLSVAGGALARAEQRDEGGGAGRVLDDAGEGGRQADELAQPLHRHLLELGRGGARLPAHPLGAEAGGDQVGEHRGQHRVGREVGEEPRVVPVSDAGENGGVEQGEQALHGDALVGCRRGEVAPHLARLDRAHDR